MIFNRKQNVHLKTWKKRQNSKKKCVKRTNVSQYNVIKFFVFLFLLLLPLIICAICSNNFIIVLFIRTTVRWYFNGCECFGSFFGAIVVFDWFESYQSFVFWFIGCCAGSICGINICDVFGFGGFSRFTGLIFFIGIAVWFLSGSQQTANILIFLCKWGIKSITHQFHSIRIEYKSNFNWLKCKRWLTFELHFPFTNRFHFHCVQIAQVIVLFGIGASHVKCRQSTRCITATECRVWPT